MRSRFRKKGFGVEPAHVRLLVEGLHLDEGAPQGGETLGLELAVFDRYQRAAAAVATWVNWAGMTASVAPWRNSSPSGSEAQTASIRTETKSSLMGVAAGSLAPHRVADPVIRIKNQALAVLR